MRERGRGKVFVRSNSKGESHDLLGDWLSRRGPFVREQSMHYVFLLLNWLVGKFTPGTADAISTLILSQKMRYLPLLPCDYFRILWLFCPGPEVITISDFYCNRCCIRKCVYKTAQTKVRPCGRWGSLVQFFLSRPFEWRDASSSPFLTLTPLNLVTHNALSPSSNTEIVSLKRLPCLATGTETKQMW